MRSHHRLACGLIVLALVAVGCGEDVSDAERAACEAAEGLLAASNRQALRARVDTMVTESARGENPALEEAARSYEDALDEADEAEAAAAIGRFYDECVRLNLDVPGQPAD